MVYLERQYSETQLPDVPANVHQRKTDSRSEIPVENTLKGNLGVGTNLVIGGFFASEKKLKEGEVLFKEGDQALGLFYVKSGVIKLVANRPFTRGRTTTPEFINKLVSAGEYFGYKTLIENGRYDYFAEVLQNAEVIFYPRAQVEKLLNSEDPLVKGLLTQITKDIHQFETVGQLHYLASVKERIAYQLYLLTERFGVESPRGTILNLKLTRNELAQLAGTINESLSRHLTEFKNDKVIEVSGREIVIKDKQALKQLSGNYPGMRL